MSDYPILVRLQIVWLIRMKILPSRSARARHCRDTTQGELFDPRNKLIGTALISRLFGSTLDKRWREEQLVRGSTVSKLKYELSKRSSL